MRQVPVYSIQRARGLGFLPLLAAAIPAIVGAAGSMSAAKAEAKAQKDADKAQLELAKIAAKSDKEAAASRAKWMPWAIGGGVIVVGLGLWALSRRKGSA